MSRDGAVISNVDVNRGASSAALSVSSAHARKALRLLAAVIGAASLAACAQTAVVSERSQALPSRTEPTRSAASPARTRVAVTRTHARYASRSKAGDTKAASRGLASFYSEAQPTASGEKFDGTELTAAHPTLPFGTKLRVTDVKTGRSVTVRVNDRGPYVPGRIVDVSYSAAQSLGMVGKGVANVRLDVVE